MVYLCGGNCLIVCQHHYKSIMKFTINSKALLSRLLAANKAVSNRPTISILGNFLFELNGHIVTVTASDTDNVVVARIEASDAEGVGKVCIDAKRVTELLKAMPDCDVSFSVDDNTHAVVIRYANGKYNLTGLPGEEFPVVREEGTEAKGVLTLPATQVLNALDKVGFAVGGDDMAQVLNGVYWDIKTDAITFVASDTRVLAKYRSTQVVPGVEIGFTLPGKSVSLLRAIIGKQSEIKLTVYDKTALFEGNDFVMRSTLYVGRYPDYNRIINTNQPISVTIDRQDFINAISRVSICADSQTSLLQLNISNGAIDLVAQDLNFNVGGEERISCDYFGSPLTIGFSSAYLKGLLSAMDTQNIVMKLSESTRPGLFLPAENDEYGELTLLCMPMSVKTV